MLSLPAVRDGFHIPHVRKREPLFWHGWKALFPQPPVLETGALH